MQSRLTAYVLVGPTCTGKSAVAQTLAERFGRDIVSADSMLVYRGMNIGTAKPTPNEIRRARMRMVDVAEPFERYSVGLYRDAALTALRDIRDAGREAIVVGGSGLYLKALLSGLKKAPGAHPAFRLKCETLLRKEGISALQKALQTQAPDRWAVFPDRNNPTRLMRALEIAEFGDPDSAPHVWRDPVDLHPVVGLTYPNDVLNRRIDARIDTMYRQGLLNEVAELMSRYPFLSRTACQAIGYADAIACLENRCLVSEAKAMTATRTRQFAKRQRTWFRKQMNVAWVEPDENACATDVAQQVAAAWERLGPAPIAELD